MATTLTVNLSSALQTQLSVGGVYLTILVFDSSQDSPISMEIYAGDGSQDGPIPATVNVPLTAGSGTLNGGKIYFVIQSTDASTPLTFDSQSDINWQSAADNSYRYDSVEISLLNAPGDAANLTSVEGFGIPMELSATTGTVGYNVTGNTLFTTDLPATSTSGTVVYTYTEGPLAGQDRMAISPTAAVPIGNSAFSSADWTAYIDSLKGSAASDIVLNGLFNGAPDVQAGLPAGAVGEWRNAGFFSYALEWDSTNQVFWLSPTANSQIQGYIKITADQLADSIYSSLGTVEIYTSKTDADPYMVYDTGADPTSQMNVGANNQWGKVLQQFTNGFTAGYYGVTGQSLNGQVTAGIDLNKNYNQDPTYAFGSHLSGSGPLYYDHYSKVFFDNTNSYGSTYSDALTAAFSEGGPLLPVYQNGANITSLTLNMYADGETPAGYVTPTINNYIAPTNGTTYEVATYQNTGSSITLDFGTGQSLVMREDVPIVLKFITGYNGTTPIWTSLQLGSATETPWQTWTVVENSGVYSVVGNGGAGQDPSSLVITNPPVSASGVNWYQVVVGEGSTQKTYNVYATTNGSYEFVDPTTSPGVDYAADGLATVTPGALRGDGSLLTFTVAVTGATPTLDLSLLEWNTSSTYLNGLATPSAPVAGSLSNSAFTAISGQTSLTAPSITSSAGEFAFGWTGNNNDASTSSWISGYTNKIYGLQAALLTITSTIAGSLAPIAAYADIDGQWATAVQQQLGNGTYTIDMTQYLASDTAFATPIGKESSALTLTVDMSDLDLNSTASGLVLVDDSSGTQGNWISFSTTSSSLPAGATLILYRTNGAGELVDPNGDVVTDVADAALAFVGNVKTDAGATIFSGNQMVYLGVGQELHFAVQTGEGGINLSPTMSATDQGDGTYSLNVGGIQLTAGVSNTLDAADNMASVQRMYDMPLVYLQQGQTLTVDVAGSAQNTNDLHFVRFEVDANSGEIMVGGVAYGDTDAFHAAVMANLDTGFSASYGGASFSDSDSWTVAGSDGFYAPVLITQSGEIFVPGTGNDGGAEYIRIFGENTFGFEDLSVAQGSDFDYNDMVMRLTPVDSFG